MNPTPEDMNAAAALADAGGPHQYTIAELNAHMPVRYPGGYVCGPTGYVTLVDSYYPVHEPMGPLLCTGLCAESARLAAENAALSTRVRELEAIVSATVKK
jgi:hypothetical protein